MKICVNVCNMSLCLVLLLDLQLPCISRVSAPTSRYSNLCGVVAAGWVGGTGFAKSQHRGTVTVKLHCQ